MAHEAGSYHLPGDAEPLFDLYEQLYDVSDGLVTPLVGQLLADAGYDAEYSLQTKELHTVPEWFEVMDYTFPELRIKQPALLDVGAAGKGYLVDIIAELIEASGVHGFCINAGGDIRNHNVSSRLSRIGLEHPRTIEQVIGIADIPTGSICGSAGNRRTWNGFTHIMNPRTKQPPTNVLATWVSADTALVADGLATALFFVKASKLRERFTFAYAIIREDLSLEYSNDFPAQFFSEATKGDMNT